MKTEIVVVGGGPAGMMAAGTAAQNGAEVLLLEKNEQLGKKLLITGKGRCNLTNDCSIERMIENFPETGSFLYSALYTFPNHQLRNFFAELGVPTKVERGDRVFPESDSARDVVDALKGYLKDKGVEIRLKTAVNEILVEEGAVKGVMDRDGNSYLADKVVFTPGGASYPTTGSSGDGYEMLETVGHRIKSIKPSLVPLQAKEGWVASLEGLTLKNVEAGLYLNEEEIDSEFGELLFTDDGVSGPIVLTLSRDVVSRLGEGSLKLKIDLKPALDEQTLDNRLQRDFEKYSRKQFKNSLGDLLPSKLIPVIVDLVSIPADKKVNQITVEERRELMQLVKELEVTIIGTKGLRQAIVTKGGVMIDEIDPQTMESKLVSDLYLAGEVIDIDAYTGGFNLQAAFSTGYLAGINVVD
ncbi:NAD(P)/FAD-dependent oxidoreductase [Acetohalobium arabaticum]|uniref:HI0933 family protein n=1 Tax=Acetohalobium arabaticum (strain ATCC 49924 / DSM 5501 / Z-7288) TaxID=574087 RepID=D9QPV9_ACEAZ|nr:NAD(P)/FAD-dependent oxidoreductase [Acetohalobium arabaticum]ADL12550.1 HI0933 family protein [Acetohalobium arabaticum DSM 5501]